MRLPDGFFERVGAGGAVLAGRSDRMDALITAALDRKESWEAALAAPSAARTGRGPSARVVLESGPALHVKKLRRGGLLAKLRGNRFWGEHRLVANLAVPHEAIRRGVATPAPVALLRLRAGAGRYEAWLAVEEIPSAESLHARFASGAISDDELAAAVRAARDMHDRGIVHRDLNLGNLLTRRASAGWEAFVIDLDRGSVESPPVSMRARRAAVRRLERSYEKWFGSSRLAQRPDWFDLYAAGREDLRPLLSRGRTIGRLGLWLHRLGWRVNGRGSGPLAEPGASRRTP